MLIIEEYSILFAFCVKNIKILRIKTFGEVYANDDKIIKNVMLIDINISIICVL